MQGKTAHEKAAKFIEENPQLHQLTATYLENLPCRNKKTFAQRHERNRWIGEGNN